MRNKYSIVWSKRSKDKTDQIIDYLTQEWTDKEVFNYLNLLKNFEEVVSRFPKLFPKSLSHPKSYRRAVISKHYSVIYRVEENKIFVVTIQDNREFNS